MPPKNGIPGKSQDSQEIRNEINYWKQQNIQRKCSDFSDMAYWEVMCTNNAL
ncbi:hypothetical protein [Aquimarina algicola]|uniref:hypothetical protein n=1 Tax=Aquimarina algicola TaxID=2589995 RepID=UPI001CF33A48|nr:hypothetical protein [Aquimarina algicola]